MKKGQLHKRRNKVEEHTVGSRYAQYGTRVPAGMEPSGKLKDGFRVQKLVEMMWYIPSWGHN
jgi:hypothetical protein